MQNKYKNSERVKNFKYGEQLRFINGLREVNDQFELIINEPKYFR